MVPSTTDKKNNNSNVILIILLVLGGLTIIGVAAYFIFFYKKKKVNAEDNLKDKGNENIDAVENQDDMPKIKEKSAIDEAFEEKEPTSIEDALDDLMKTKEIIDDNNNESL